MADLPRVSLDEIVVHFQELEDPRSTCSAPLKSDHRLVVAIGATDHCDRRMAIHCCSNSLGVRYPSEE
jgi:hypothetical protein